MQCPKPRIPTTFRFDPPIKLIYTYYKVSKELCKLSFPLLPYLIEYLTFSEIFPKTHFFNDLWWYITGIYTRAICIPFSTTSTSYVQNFTFSGNSSGINCFSDWTVSWDAKFN